MTAFYSRLPRELVEAARIDGASLLQVWWHVMLPMGRPALITLGILNTLYCWNDVLISLLVLQKERTSWSASPRCAANTPPTSRSSPPASSSPPLPIVVIYVVFQRQIVTGIAVGAVKGLAMPQIVTVATCPSLRRGSR